MCKSTLSFGEGGGERRQEREESSELLKVLWSLSKGSLFVSVLANFDQDFLSRVEIKKCDLYLGYVL